MAYKMYKYTFLFCGTLVQESYFCFVDIFTFTIVVQVLVNIFFVYETYLNFQKTIDNLVTQWSFNRTNKNSVIPQRKPEQTIVTSTCFKENCCKLADGSFSRYDRVCYCFYLDIYNPIISLYRYVSVLQFSY